MAFSVQINQTFRGTGLTITSTITKEADGQVLISGSLPAATDGDLTTRTDDNTGDVTCDVNTHGITNSDTVGVFWSGGSRLGMNAVVNSAVISVDGGSGDVLPAANTAVTIAKEVAFDFAFDGDEIECVSVWSDERMGIRLDSDTPVVEDVTENEGWSYVNGQVGTNPITGNAVTTLTACDGATSNSEIRAVALYDATP